VIASQAALAGAAVPARTVYLDLRDYAARQDAGGTPFTQSVQTFYALDEALCEYFEQGGRDARRRLFEARLTAIREVLGELGVHALLPATESSCVLNAFELPPGRSYAELHAALKARGFIIYAGQGALSERVFRISAMGEIGPADLERLALALREALA
jgi:2-aminoethylphosphonate-pyruvate transaminase